MFCLRTLSSRPLRKNAQWRLVERLDQRCVTNVAAWLWDGLVSFVVLHRIHESVIHLTHPAIYYHARGLVQMQHFPIILLTEGCELNPCAVGMHCDTWYHYYPSLL